ncbi:MAG TPA: CHAT domain-containing tetratricopeptide repeat protein, partial [Thermoanaerobaculia bacterium]
MKLLIEQIRLRDGASQTRVLRRNVDWQRREGRWQIIRYTTDERQLVATINDAAALNAFRKRLTELPDLANEDLARALVAKAWSFSNRDDDDLALEIARLSREVAASVADSVTITRALCFVSAIERVRGNLGAALIDADEALRVATASGNIDEIARAEVSRGRIFVLRGDLELARGALQRALALRDEISEQTIVVRALNHLANVMVFYDDYLQTIQYLQQAAHIAEQWADLSEKLAVETNTAEVFVYQGRPDLALEAFQRLQPIMDKSGDRFSSTVNLMSTGEAYKRLGRFDEAIATFRRTLEVGRVIDDARLIVESLNSLAALEMKKGHLADAAGHLRESIERSRKVEFLSYLWVGVGLLGELRLQEGKLNEALASAEEALALARKTNTALEAADSLTLTGRVLRALGRSAEARRSFLEAIEHVEYIREQFLGGETGKERGFEQLTAPYVNLVDLLVAEGHPAEALEIAERAKGRVLMEVLASGRTDRDRFLSVEERSAEAAMRLAISQLNRSIQQTPDEAKLAQLRESLRQKRFDYEKLEFENDARHPELKLRHGNVARISTSESLHLLPQRSDAAVIEFVVTPERTHIFIVSRPAATKTPQIKIHTVPIRREDLDALTERLAANLGSRNLGFRQPAHQLYQLLFAPLEPNLEGARTLCVIPDGTLWRIPLQTLLDGHDRFLIEKYTMFYAPSMSVLQATERSASRDHEAAGKTLLAFGNPHLAGAEVDRIRPAYRSGDLQPLPHAESEVRSLARLYGESSRIYIGEAADERTAKTESGNFKILHFATHGNLNDANPMYSHVVLSPSGGEDGLLEAWEMMEMHLKADLVVLSACESARGRIGSGEGLIGLAWALFVAGSRTTVATEWKVESESTSRLMVDFHRALVHHDSENSSIAKAESLRAAQLELMQNSSY